MKINNVHAETSLIATIITNYSDETSTGMFLQARGEIDENFFYDHRNRYIFQLMTKAVKINLPPQVSHLTSFIEEEQLPFDVLGYITTLVNYATSSDIEKLLPIVKRMHTARCLKSVCESSINELASSEDVMMSIEGIERNMTDAMLAGVTKHKDEGFASEYIGDYFKLLNEQMSGNVEVGIPTGLKELDNLTGGLKRGDLITVCGRTGMGKSSLIATWIAHQIMAGYKPALFTFELQRKEVMDKLISILSELDTNGKDVSFSALNNPAGHFGGSMLTGADLERVSYLMGKYIKESMFFIRGKSKMKVEEGMSICRKLKQENKIDVAYFDHIGLMVADKSNAQAELSHITGSLLLFAGEMNIPVVQVAQLNRGADTVTEKPRLSHLKGSGSIEEDANMIILPWRPYAINREGDPSESEIILAKSRNTGTGEFPSYFSTLSTMFSSVQQDYENGADRF